MRIRRAELGVGILWAILIAGGLSSARQAAAASRHAEPPLDTVHVVNSSDLAKKRTVVLTGNWILRGDLVLNGNVHITFRNAHVDLKGNLFLNGNAVLSIEQHSIFNIAQKQSFQYRAEAKGNSSLQVMDSEIETNGGTADVMFPTSFIANDDASLIVKNAHLDMKRNWFLGGFKDHSKCISENTQDLPNEIYPEDASTIQITGRNTQALVWIKFVKDQFAVLDDMPNTSQPYTWSFGRNRPGKTNVKYEVDVKDAPVGINLQSVSGSNITVANNRWPIGIGYTVDGATQPEVVRGLDGGTERKSFVITNGRKLTIVHSLIVGWQFGVSHSTQPITLEDSSVNESIAGDGGTIYARRCKFLDGGLAAFGKGAKYDVDDSDIRSFSVFTNHDGLLKIQNSTIHGSTIQSSDEGRIILLNDDITTNTNVVYGAVNGPAHFITEGKGSILDLGITAPKPAQLGASISFTGDAFVDTKVKDMIGHYELLYRKVDQKKMISISNANQAAVHGGILGTLNTKKLTPGNYVAVLQMLLSDGTHYEVQRPFSIVS